MNPRSRGRARGADLLLRRLALDAVRRPRGHRPRHRPPAHRRDHRRQTGGEAARALAERVHPNNASPRRRRDWGPRDDEISGRRCRIGGDGSAGERLSAVFRSAPGDLFQRQPDPQAVAARCVTGRRDARSREPRGRRRALVVAPGGESRDGVGSVAWSHYVGRGRASTRVGSRAAPRAGAVARERLAPRIAARALGALAARRRPDAPRVGRPQRVRAPPREDRAPASRGRPGAIHEEPHELARALLLAVSPGGRFAAQSPQVGIAIGFFREAEKRALDRGSDGRGDLERRALEGDAARAILRAELRRERAFGRAFHPRPRARARVLVGRTNRVRHIVTG